MTKKQEQEANNAGALVMFIIEVVIILMAINS